jgi:hypothetical protein
MWPDWKDTTYWRVDAVLMIVIGSIVGYFIHRPQNDFQAMVAGLSWVGAVRTATGRTRLDSRRVSRKKKDSK